MGQETSSHGNISYLIDETVVLDGDDRAYHVWDLEMDPSKEDKYALTAISREGRRSGVTSSRRRKSVTSRPARTSGGSTVASLRSN